jgi:hypothetical protein
LQQGSGVVGQSTQIIFKPTQPRNVRNAHRGKTGLRLASLFLAVASWNDFSCDEFIVYRYALIARKLQKMNCIAEKIDVKEQPPIATIVKDEDHDFIVSFLPALHAAVGSTLRMLGRGIPKDPMNSSLYTELFGRGQELLIDEHLTGKLTDPRQKILASSSTGLQHGKRKHSHSRVYKSQPRGKRG